MGRACSSVVQAAGGTHTAGCDTALTTAFEAWGPRLNCCVCAREQKHRCRKSESLQPALRERRSWWRSECNVSADDSAIAEGEGVLSRANSTHGGDPTGSIAPALQVLESSHLLGVPCKLPSHRRSGAAVERTGCSHCAGCAAADAVGAGVECTGYSRCAGGQAAARTRCGCAGGCQRFCAVTTACRKQALAP